MYEASQFGPPLIFFTSDNHHIELSLPKFSETFSNVHIGDQGTKVG